MKIIKFGKYEIRKWEKRKPKRYYVEITGLRKDPVKLLVKRRVYLSIEEDSIVPNMWFIRSVQDAFKPSFFMRFVKQAGSKKKGRKNVA